MITTTTPRTRNIVTVLVAIAGALSAARALRPSWEVATPTEANLAEEKLQDFRDALYFPIREFMAGGNPYDPAAMFAHWPVRQNFNLYQPYHLVLHLPFALPDYRIGAIAFTLASLLLLGVLALLAARRARLPLVLGTVVIAALLVGVVRGITIHFEPAAGEASIYVLMFLVLLVRPRGLLGERIEKFE